MAETADRGGRALLESLERGQVCKGVVSSTERFGAFVDIGGFHGLVNAAELTWAHHFDAVSDIVEVGQQVTIVVLDVDVERERASFSLKAKAPDPAGSPLVKEISAHGEAISVKPQVILCRSLHDARPQPQLVRVAGLGSPARHRPGNPEPGGCGGGPTPDRLSGDGRLRPM